MKKIILLILISAALSNCHDGSEPRKDIVPVSDTANKTATSPDATKTVVGDSSASSKMKDSARTDSMH